MMVGVLPVDWRDRPCPICAPFDDPKSEAECGSTYQKRGECCVALDGPFMGLPCWYVLAERYEAAERSLAEASEWAEEQP